MIWLRYMVAIITLLASILCSFEVNASIITFYRQVINDEYHNIQTISQGYFDFYNGAISEIGIGGTEAKAEYRLYKDQNTLIPYLAMQAWSNSYISSDWSYYGSQATSEIWLSSTGIDNIKTSFYFSLDIREFFYNHVDYGISSVRIEDNSGGLVWEKALEITPATSMDQFSQYTIGMYSGEFTLRQGEWLKVIANAENVNLGVAGIYSLTNVGNFRITSVPLPGTLLLFGSGLLGLAGLRRFRKI